MIEYLHFTCEADHLQDRLTEAGNQGWRLHTCEPVPTYGPNGSGTLFAFVVMDKLIVAEEEAPDEEPEERGGIQMKG